MKFKVGQKVVWSEAIGTIVEIVNLKKKTYRVDFGFLIEIPESQLKEYA